MKYVFWLFFITTITSTLVFAQGIENNVVGENQGTLTIQNTVNANDTSTIDGIIADFKSEKIELTDEAKKIKIEIDRIKGLLKEKGNPDEQKQQRSYLKKLENSLVENDLMHQKLEGDMRRAIDDLEASLSEKENQVKVMEQEQSRTHSIFQKNFLFLATLSFSFLGLAVILFATIRKISLQNKSLAVIQENLENKIGIINKQHLKITDSIRYAQTIQQAILPTDEKIATAFSEHFIIYLPKDIVSGDFYWFSQIQDKEREVFFLAVVDCTGHGVPGAFMSMIGNTILNEIISQNQSEDPEEILEILNHEVQLALHQHEKANDDGMDVCLCKFEYLNEEIVKVTFSGAKRPLYITRGRYNLLEYFKGDNKTIGGHQGKKRKFTSKEIFLRKDDTLFLTSDGLIDQHNSKRKKIGSLKFSHVLQDNMEAPLGDIKNKLLQTLEEHQGETDQRDDITIVGIRI